MENQYLEVSIDRLLEAYWKDLKKNSLLTSMYDGLQFKLGEETYTFQYERIKD